MQNFRMRSLKMSSCSKISSLKGIVYTPLRLPLHPLNTSTSESRKRKSWEEYSDRHKKRKVEELKDKVNDITDSQFEVTAVHVRNKDTGSSEIISTNAELPVAKVSAIPQSEDHVKVLLVKQWFGISNQAYHELSKLDGHLPRSCKVQKEVKQMISGKYFLPR